jgi:hypothetical protein
MIAGMRPATLSHSCPVESPIKMPGASPRRFFSPVLRILAPCAVLSGAATALADGARDKKPVVMEPYVVDAVKTDVLFRGTDISVVLDKDAYPVRDVAGSSWVVGINGVDRTISAKRAPVNLKMTSGLKLTETSASIVGFSRTPGYSFANDPMVIQSRALMKSAMTNAMLQGVAQDARDLQDTVGNAAMGPMATFAASDKQFGDASLMHTAEVAAAMLHPPKMTPGSTTPPLNPLVPTTFDGLIGNGLALREATAAALHADANVASATEPLGKMTTRGFDAMEVDFSVSSAKQLRAPYVVTVALFHDTTSKPGAVQKLVFAKALDPIESRLSHVHFSEEGFPYDYELIDFQVHIYDRGVEIPTNLSPDRVDMSRDEAFQYIKAEYIAAHKGVTRPPTVAMGKLPAELPTRIAAGQYADVFYVKVSKDGMAEDAFVDPTCSRRIEDSFHVSVVQRLRFKPALDNGEPAEGIAPLNLSKLQI